MVTDSKRRKEESSPTQAVKLIFISVVATLASGLTVLSWGLSASALVGVGCYFVAASAFPPEQIAR